MNTEPIQEEKDAPPPARSGFARLSEERRREIAQIGGRAAHAAGTAHRFTPEEARIAGRKGAAARRASTRTETP